jgi:dipeptidase E
MRLYLSSFRIGDHPEKLVELSGKGGVAIISNALDFIPDDVRRKYEAEVYNPRKEFSDLGLASSDLDLRHYWENRSRLRDDIRKFGLVWIQGGNAFLLMRALHRSGFPDVIRELLARDEIAYGGFSAGAVVATPTLQGIELMDDPTQLADGYEPEVRWQGMGLVDFSIVPHYRSNHPEAESAEAAVSFMERNGLPFKALSDGEVFIVNNDVGALLPGKAASGRRPAAAGRDAHGRARFHKT